jgi:hypothetical protein
MTAMSDWAAPDTGVAPARPRPATAVTPATAPRATLPRPRSSLELLDAAARLVRRRAGVVVPAVLAIVLPVQVVAVALERATGLDDAGLAGLGLGWLSAQWLELAGVLDGGQLLAALAVSALRSLAIAVAGVVLAHVVSAHELGGPLTAGQALGRGLRRLPTTAATWAMAKTALVLGSCLVIGFPLVVAWTLLVSPVIALEGAGPWRALRRSIGLVNRRFFPCVGFVALTALVSTVVVLAFAALPLLAGLAPALERVDWLLTALAELLATLVVVPLVGGGAAFAYFDVRIRTEGIDLQIELERG